MTGFFLEAKELLAKKSVSLSFVFIPGKEQVYWESLAKDDLFTMNYSHFPRLLNKFFEDNNLPFFDSTSYLRNQSKNQLIYFPIDGHFNNEGNKLFAKYILKNLLTIK